MTSLTTGKRGEGEDRAELAWAGWGADRVGGLECQQGGRECGSDRLVVLYLLL